MTKPTFKANLAGRLDEIGNRLCVGIDPHLAALPPFFFEQLQKKGPEEFLNHFCDAVIDASQGIAAVLKFQSAFFEAHGPSGFAVLQGAMKRARAAGFFTILDAKRGDIASTMEAYGQMAFDAFDADALTVVPYMGYDVISPLARWLKDGRGVYVVWISSNPSGAAIQDLEVPSNGGGKIALYESLLNQFLNQAGKEQLGEAIGLVLGTTKLGVISESLLAKIAPQPLLLPGVGPQGGAIDAKLTEFLQQSAASVIPMSRALCGFGDSSQRNELCELRGWGDYATYVSCRVKDAAQALSATEP